MDLLLIIIPTILIIVSQLYINKSYNKYSTYSVSSNMTGYDVARKILDANGLSNVKIKKVNGTLTDHYNPKTNTVSLSSDIYSDSSIASVSVSAHECGHVIQHKEKYPFIVLRSFLVPVVNISSKLGYVILMVGFFASLFDLALIGLIFMCASLIFQLVTLPTEFNASKRARAQLLELKVIKEDELPQVREMLNSAAMTYVASFFANILEMLRLFLILRNDD